MSARGTAPDPASIAADGAEQRLIATARREEFGEVDHALAAAQAFATLALVEEQRTANLLAYLGQVTERREALTANGTPHSEAIEVGRLTRLAHTLDHTVRARLGLEP